jgi:hypothetical protein
MDYYFPQKRDISTKSLEFLLTSIYIIEEERDICIRDHDSQIFESGLYHDM